MGGGYDASTDRWNEEGKKTSRAGILSIDIWVGWLLKSLNNNRLVKQIRELVVGF